MGERQTVGVLKQCKPSNENALLRPLSCKPLSMAATFGRSNIRPNTFGQAHSAEPPFSRVAVQPYYIVAAGAVMPKTKTRVETKEFQFSHLTLHGCNVCVCVPVRHVRRMPVDIRAHVRWYSTLLKHKMLSNQNFGYMLKGNPLVPLKNLNSSFSKCYKTAENLLEF